MSVMVCDFILLRSWAKWRANGMWRLLLALTLAVAAELGLRLTDERAFQWVFSTSVPDGVVDIVAERLGPGPSDYVLLMEFRTDRETLEQLLALRGF
ncbi:MAG: hypothetical protein ACE5EX_01900 [Phycisphaerae bacterium]